VSPRELFQRVLAWLRAQDARRAAAAAASLPATAAPAQLDPALAVLMLTMETGAVELMPTRPMTRMAHVAPVPTAAIDDGTFVFVDFSGPVSVASQPKGNDVEYADSSGRGYTAIAIAAETATRIKFTVATGTVGVDDGMMAYDGASGRLHDAATGAPLASFTIPVTEV
jgi:hypothetical protein